MTAFEIPTLTTDRLRLRAFCAGDLDAFAAMRATRRGALSGYGAPVCASRGLADDDRVSWPMGATRLWRVGLRKDRQRAFVGAVGTYHPLDWPEPEIIYSLDQPFWRQGFATEASRAARNWLFEHFPFARAASFIRPENFASKRVAERLGAVYESTSESRASSFEGWVHYRTGGS